MRPAQWSRRRRVRNPLGALAVLAAIGLVAVIVAVLQPPGPVLSGNATAVDGDTLRLGATRIRLVGLDAVERGQTCTAPQQDWACGEEASRFLAAAVAGRTTTCRSDGRDRYGRVLARCTAGAGDLGEAVVRAGWATADLEYALALADARLNRRGIWAGRFDDPADWRRAHSGEGDDFWAWLASVLGR